MTIDLKNVSGNSGLACPYTFYWWWRQDWGAHCRLLGWPVLLLLLRGDGAVVFTKNLMLMLIIETHTKKTDTAFISLQYHA